MNARSTVPAILSATLLAGCGGGGGYRALPQAPAAGTQATHAAPGAKGTATLRITIPKKTASASARSAQYVSPATAQMLISITQGGSPVSGYPQTVSLTPTSNGCSSTLASTFCQFTLALAPGSYTASLTAEDPGGTALSAANALAFTIVAGQANTIPVTLGGIPASIQVTPVGGGYLRGDTGGLRLWGPSSQLLALEALDADGNAIVGPGAPTYAVSASNAQMLTATIPNPVTAPNIASVGAAGSGVTPGSYGLTVTATPAGGSGATAIAQTIPLALAHAVVYASDGYNDSVYGFYDGHTSADITIAIPYFAPQLAVDHNGTLYVTNYSGSSVTLYPAGSTTAAQTLTSNIDEPSSIAVDAAGNLYVQNADYSNNNYNLVEFPAGSTTSTILVTNSTYESQLATDALGNLYENEGNSIIEYAAGTHAQSTVVSNVTIDPSYMTVLPNGAIFAAQSYGTDSGIPFALINPAAGTATTAFYVPYADQGSYQVASDVAGNVWLSFHTGGTVSEYTTSGTVLSTISLPGYEPYATGVAVFPAPNVSY